MTRDAEGELVGEVAVVTGAGRGVGRAIAQRLASAGATVWLIARSAEEIDRAASDIESDGGSAKAVALDVTDRAAVERAFDAIDDVVGPASILVNNAGTLDAIGPLWESDSEAWWRDVEVHVRGTMLCTHAALARMVPRRAGRVVNVVGMLGQMGEPYSTAYSCAKAALFRLTDCLARELDEHGVKIFCVSPGSVRTDMTVRLAETVEGRRWLPEFGELADDEWVPVERGAGLVLRFARGDADALSGRYVHVSQDLDELIAQADEIRSADRLVMRVVP